MKSRFWLKTACVLWVHVALVFIPGGPLQSQLLQPRSKPLPVDIGYRKSAFGGSYVLQIRNNSQEDLDIWLQAKGKTAQFTVLGGTVKDIGWAQGFKFDARNQFLIWGAGYDTISQVIPDFELSPWRIGFSNEGGVAVSFSQLFVQNQLGKHLRLPIKQKASNAFEVALDEVPQINLREGSGRVYAIATLHVSLFSGALHFPLPTGVSFIPLYNRPTGEVTATQIKIENIDVKISNTDISLLPKEWLDDATKAINQVLPLVFEKFVLYKIEKQWILNLADAVYLRAKVIDGRLEVIFF